MYLRALRLNGFKSFADAIELKFDPGVTAIVGPNGCGKSNIADAIRWVLGEQSAKALRGGRMQDVIFEGTDQRRPLQLCEVSLLLTDCEAQLGTDFHEVEITRRVSRDGSSDYLINGRACRLKDIQKLFMDTGVGRTSYSIMAQGQIDQILSSKPEERRAVFEEAAGITKYKSQRREALNKLALVDTNLGRITDVIDEVARQIGSLRRQASKALRYRRLSHRLRHLDLAQGGRNFALLGEAVGGSEAELLQRSEALRILQADLEEKEAELAARKLERTSLLQRVQEAQQSVFDLKSRREEANNQAHLADIRRSGLEERIVQARDELAAVEGQLMELSERADASTQDKQLQLGVLGDSDEVFQSRNRGLSSVEERLRQSETKLQQLKYRILEAESGLVRLRNDCSNLEVDDRTARAHGLRLADEFAEQEGAEAAAREALAVAGRQLEASRRKQTASAEAITAAQEGLAALAGRFRDVQRRIQECDRNLAQKTARLRLLQQLQEKLEGYGDGAKALLQGRLVGFEGRTFAAASAGLKVHGRYVRAVETLLGAAVEAVVVNDGETAQAILAQMAERKLGRACLQFPAAGDDSAGAPPPPGARTAHSVLELSAEVLAAHPAARILERCLVVERLDDFLAFWRANPGFEFLLAASVDGELIDRRGLVFGGQRKGGPGILQRTVELKDIGAEIEADGAVLANLRTEAEGIGRGLNEAEAALEELRRAHVEATREAAAAAAEERNARKLLQDVEVRRSRLERERASIEETHRRATERLEKARGQFADGEQRLSALRAELETTEQGLVALRGERDVHLEAVTQARFDLAEKRQRLEVLNRGLSEIASRRAALGETRTGRAREIDAWTLQIAELANEARTRREAAEACGHTLAIAQQSVESTRGRLVGLEEALRVLEREQAHVRGQADEQRGEVSRLQVGLAERRTRLQFLQEEATREHNVDLKIVDWRHEMWMAGRQPEGLRTLDLDEEAEGDEAREATGKAAPTEDPAPAAGQPTPGQLAALEATDWDAVRHEVAALRQRIQNMGPVNVVAIEEYGELRQRYDFLKTQCDDLVDSKARLLAAIDEINRTSEQQFATTFDQVRRNFAQTFRTLFNGGHADLELQKSEDVLESGIEIVAQPPGTRLRGISLLSGGQRTMTAVGLLFAIYMVKPSPFCVLDELDAPLDESNIGRFTALLKQFVGDSQFIIITHNKRTIAASQSIYGVTMEERGVSKVVSMRFHSEHDEPELARLATAAASS